MNVEKKKLKVIRLYEIIRAAQKKWTTNNRHKVCMWVRDRMSEKKLMAFLKDYNLLIREMHTSCFQVEGVFEV